MMLLACKSQLSNALHAYKGATTKVAVFRVVQTSTGRIEGVCSGNLSPCTYKGFDAGPEF